MGVRHGIFLGILISLQRRMLYSCTYNHWTTSETFPLHSLEFLGKDLRVEH